MKVQNATAKRSSWYDRKRVTGLVISKRDLILGIFTILLFYSFTKRGYGDGDF